MRRFIGGFILCLLLGASPVFADNNSSNNGCQGNCPNTGGGTTTINNAPVGLGGQGGSGVSTSNANAAGYGGAATAVTGPVTSTSKGGDANQKQGQTQGQGQVQSNSLTGTVSGAVDANVRGAVNSRNANDSSARTDNDITVNVRSGGDRPDLPPAPPATSPNLIASPETCMGSTSVGASSPFGGVSFGTTWKSDDCELRMYARTLIQMGLPQVALALLVENEKVARAARRMGIILPGDPLAPNASTPVRPGTARQDPPQAPRTAQEAPQGG